jgi:hypothetical protein
VRVCPSCGHENPDDVDFCQNCGQYVRWEPTTVAPSVKPAAAAAATEAPPAPPPAEVPPGDAPPVQPAPAGAPAPAPDGDGAAAAEAQPAVQPQPAAAAPPAAAAAAAPAQPAAPAEPPPAAPPPEPTKPEPQIDPDAIVMDLKVPGVEVEGPVSVSVQAGGVVRVSLLIRNQSGIVDNYDISVEGIPETWWTATPPTVYLVPYGTASDGYEQEVTIDLHPPRSAEAEARPWVINVTAGSRAYQVEIGRREATLVVEPYYELESEMRPERKSGRTRARFAVAIRNKANAATDIELSALDSENQIVFDFERERFPTKPGRRAGSVFYARPLKQNWIGRKVEHRFTVNAQAAETDIAAVPRLGVFVQKPWIPYWVLVVLPLLIVAAIAAYLLWPRNVTVPNVRTTRKLLTAQHMLEKRGLKLGKVTEKTTDLRPPGSPINTSPPIGTKVKKGSTVDLVLAVGTGLKVVPDVTGLSLADADAALKKAGFQVGQQSPAPSDPSQKVQKQVPEGNKKAKVGAPVDLFFAPAQTTSSTSTATSTTTTATSTGGGAKTQSNGNGSGNGSGSVIPGGGTGGSASDAALAKLGIVFDNGNDVLEIGAKAGKPIKKLAASPDVEVTPAVSPDGSQIAYARGKTIDTTQIWLEDPKKPQFAHALTNAGFQDRHPVFAPNGKVIAFIRTKKSGKDSDLCFIPVTASAGAPSCIVDPSTFVTRPAWSPDGQAILVIGVDLKAPQQRELVEYTSNTPSSGNAKNWNSLGFVTDKMHGKRATDYVDEVAWAPDGKSVAFSANWGSNAFHVVFVAVAQDVLDPKKVVSLVRVRACEIGFLTQSQLVVNQRDNVCEEPGVLVRFDASKPDKLTPLTKLGLGAEHPVLSPTAP